MRLLVFFSLSNFKDIEMCNSAAVRWYPVVETPRPSPIMSVVSLTDSAALAHAAHSIDVTGVRSKLLYLPATVA